MSAGRSWLLITLQMYAASVLTSAFAWQLVTRHGIVALTSKNVRVESPPVIKITGSIPVAFFGARLMAGNGSKNPAAFYHIRTYHRITQASPGEQA
jgi:hypothetical protein